jgi:hypothetical protein
MKIRLLDPIAVCMTLLSSVALAAGAARAAVVLHFSGQVTAVGGLLASPPAGISAGNTVSGTVVYATADATEVEVGPSERAYVFPPDSENRVTVTIGTYVWEAELQSVSLCDDACGGDFLDYIGIASITMNFPGNLGTGFLSLDYSDAETPYDLLQGHDLPDAAEDLSFGAAQVKSGTVSSSDGSAFWAIEFDVDSQTVPVETTTWGEIKALYARPRGGNKW